MSVLGVYFLLGLMLVLVDFIRAQEIGISFKEQLKVMLKLSGDEPIGLAYCLGMYVALWPIVLLLYYNNDDPNGST